MLINILLQIDEAALGDALVAPQVAQLLRLHADDIERAQGPSGVLMTAYDTHKAYSTRMDSGARTADEVLASPEFRLFSMPKGPLPKVEIG